MMKTNIYDENYALLRASFHTFGYFDVCDGKHPLMVQLPL